MPCKAKGCKAPEYEVADKESVCEAGDTPDLSRCIGYCKDHCPRCSPLQCGEDTGAPQKAGARLQLIIGDEKEPGVGA